MADSGHLAGLGLAAVERTAQLPGLGSADGLHGVPEVSGGGLVGDVAELPVEAAVGDLEEPLPGELEVEALHVDRPGLVSDDVDPALDAPDQLLGARAVGGRLQGDV